MKKRLLSLVLALAFTVSLLPTFASAAAAWEGAYKTFILDGGYRSSEQNYYTGSNALPIQFGLHDLDGDGTPELFASSGYPYAADYYAFVYRFNGSSLSYLGKQGVLGYGGVYDADSGYPGIYYEISRGGENQGYYYYVKNGTLYRESVLSSLQNDPLKPPVYTQETSDAKLYNTFYLYSAGSRELPSMIWKTANEIRSMGWENFLVQTGQNKDWPVGTEDLNAMELFLSRFSLFGNDYDCRRSIAAKSIWDTSILESMLGDFRCVSETLYPGEAIQKSASPDPKNRWTAHAKYSEAQVNWILKQILNCSDDDISILKSRLVAVSDQKNSDGLYNPYYLNGYYYSFRGGIGWTIKSSVRDVTFDGTYYKVKYTNYDHLDQSVDSTHSAVLKLKTIDGKKYWSLYYDGASFPGNMDFSLPHEGEPDPVTGFVDVPKTAYYAEPVVWAMKSNITKGVDQTHFSPNNGCTRGQVVTFLWRAAGEPEPAETGNPFTDVQEGSYYDKAVAWAVEQGITAGVSRDRFAPGSTCTRAQIVTFLWRAAGCPEPEQTGAAANSFSDVPASAYYAKAVAWAVEQEITAGVSRDRFAPGSTCTRAQVVTFLYRSAAK